MSVWEEAEYPEHPGRWQTQLEPIKLGKTTVASLLARTRTRRKLGAAKVDGAELVPISTNHVTTEFAGIAPGGYALRKDYAVLNNG